MRFTHNIETCDLIKKKINEISYFADPKCQEIDLENHCFVNDPDCRSRYSVITKEYKIQM